MKQAVVSIFALAFASSQPAAAADIAGPGGEGVRRSGAFAGVSLRLPIGGQAEAPRAMLGAGFVHTAMRADGAGARRLALSGIGLDLAPRAEPQFSIGERSLSELKLHARGSGGSTPLIVGGVVLAAGAAALALGGGGGEEDRPSPCPPGVEVCAF